MTSRVDPDTIVPYPESDTTIDPLRIDQNAWRGLCTKLQSIVDQLFEDLHELRPIGTDDRQRAQGDLGTRGDHLLFEMSEGFCDCRS
ncbi:MAG TPA: hypothetical protein PK089_05905 [Methanoregulaceae archaeon]|nr:hypothetical protein [Methanoregulaceae archaeon]